VTTTRQGIITVLACCDEILMEKKRSLTCLTSVLDFCKSSLGTHVLSPVSLYSEIDDQDDYTTVQEEVPPP
jgi:hypothetical protein